MLLAIRNGSGKGVYIFDTKEQRKKLLEKFGNVSHREFNEKDKNKALKWADVKEIANRPQTVEKTLSKEVIKEKIIEKPIIIEKTIKEEHPFISTLKEIQKRGYAYISIKKDGKEYFMWIDHVITCKTIYPCSIEPKGKLYVNLSCRASNNSFINLLKEFEGHYNNYLNSCNRYSIKSILNKHEFLHESINLQKEELKKCIVSYKQAEFFVSDNFVIVDKCYSSLNDMMNNKNEYNDVIFNLKKINIYNHKYDMQITDKNWYNEIKNIIE